MQVKNGWWLWRPPARLKVKLTVNAKLASIRMEKNEINNHTMRAGVGRKPFLVWSSEIKNKSHFL